MAIVVTVVVELVAGAWEDGALLGFVWVGSAVDAAAPVAGVSTVVAAAVSLLVDALRATLEDDASGAGRAPFRELSFPKPDHIASSATTAATVRAAATEARARLLAARDGLPPVTDAAPVDRASGGCGTVGADAGIPTGGLAAGRAVG